MDSLNRRNLLKAGAGATAAVATADPATAAGGRYDVAVIGAGVFGTWTAYHLLKAGRRVLLVDAWGPSHARASSGGESRLTRAAYGADEIYARMAWDSLKQWKWLSGQAGLPIFHPCGIVFFFGKEEPYLTESLKTHRRLGLRTELLRGPELRRRYPQVDWSGIDYGLHEPEFGILMARRSVQTLKDIYVRAGGEYLQARVRAPAGKGRRLEVDGGKAGPIKADQFCFACGPWLGKVFPEVLGDRIFVTRQPMLFFGPEAGDDRFTPARLPGWADFNDGDIWYGAGDLEGRGFKIAHDAHGPLMDPDQGDRFPTSAEIEAARAYLGRRFPGMAGRPLNEARVCQYENSSSGDFLIDRHPDFENVLLLGGGSGHGFKHGPEVGRAAAGMLLQPARAPEPRFSLATKARVENRAVH